MSGSITLDDVVGTNNAATATGGVGGFLNSIVTGAAGDITISNSVISGNSSQGAGGVQGGGLGATVTVTNTTFSNNNSTGGSGALYNAGPVFIDSSTFIGNTCQFHGGAIQNNGTLTVTNSTFVGNTSTAGTGGAITNGGGLTVTNSTFSGNSAGQGSAISTGGNTTITNSTITNNSSAVGFGALHIGGANVNLSNTIVANQAANQDCSGTVLSTTLNDLDSDGTCGVVYTANPLLGPLAANGGPTKTHALLAGSLAIDTGSCVSATDQTGKARPIGLTCDIGAFEALAGCTDPLATNYDPLAAIDNGSCTYATSSVTITIDVEDGQGGKTTKTLTLNPVP